MISIPPDLMAQLREHDQEHILSGWDSLSDEVRQSLLHQLAGLDLGQLRSLYVNRDALAKVDSLSPPRVVAAEEERTKGEKAIANGEVAVLLVAGGQGSRMGITQPKGMFPVGPVTGKSLYQLHAEKMLALSRRYGRVLPFLVMTSPATDRETRAYFAENAYFGLPAEEVTFFVQGSMPALDRQTGRLLLEAPGRLFLSPDGHGGMLAAMRSAGLFSTLAARGVRHLFYFQVDNPLVKIADPAFLGLHLRHRAEVSSKAVAKTGPSERMGVFATVDGRCRIIEYSDLPGELASATAPDGRLLFGLGSPAIHWFDLAFLTRMAADAEALPFHIARKVVPFWNPTTGEFVKPSTPNALKFERFIFDVLPLTERTIVVETPRNEEFAPLKNAEGDDSPETVRKALIQLAADWLARGGATIKADAAVEIDPLYALDEEELASRLVAGLVVDRDRYLTE